jgi:hypothetical protein
MSKEIFEIYFNSRNLELAWYRYLYSTSREVKDYDGIRRFGSDLFSNLNDLAELLRSGDYKPTRPFKFYEPKATGMQRTKSVLIVEDAIVYQAIANQIAYLNYNELTSYNDFVYGSVLNENVQKGVELIDEDVPDYYFFEYYLPHFNNFLESVNHNIENEDVVFKFETDITGFFDCIPHSKLKVALLNFGVEEEIIEFLTTLLDKWSGTRESSTPGVGIPQSVAASFMLANLILHEMDKILAKESFGYYRYMDDIRIYGGDEGELRAILVEVDSYLKGMGLSLNSKKTSIEKIKDRVKEKKKVRKYFAYNLLEESPIEDNDKKIKEKGGKEKKTFSGQESNTEQELVFEKMDENQVKEFYNAEVTEIEKFFKRNDERISKMIAKEEEDDPDLRDDYRDMAFRYRRAFRMIQTVVPEQLPEEEFLPYWYIGAEWMFYKTDNFLWNIMQYGRQEKYSSEVKNKLFSWLGSGIVYEWVNYHIIGIMISLKNLKRKDLKIIYEILICAKSPLIRKACYKLLINKLEPTDQLMAKLKRRLDNEEEFLVKSEILGDLYVGNEASLSPEEMMASLGI